MPDEIATSVVDTGVLRFGASVFAWLTGGDQEEMTRHIDAAMLRAVERAVLPALKLALSDAGPPPSDPFTPPHKQTDEDHARMLQYYGAQHLVDSLTAFNRDGETYVGATNSPYAMYLEIGTRTMAPRPWLLPTVYRSDVQAAFALALASELMKSDTGPGDLGVA